MSDFSTYQDVMGAGKAASPALQEQFADIVTNAPGQTATESQFVYQTADKDWSVDPTGKPEERSWQEKYIRTTGRSRAKGS